MKKYFLVCVYAILFNCVMIGQTTTLSQLNPSEIKLFNEAKKAAQSKDFTKSIKKFEQLLKTKPAFVEGILRLASNYHSAGQADKAETLFKSAIEKEPEFDPEMYYSLALIQMAQKKFKEAAQQFDTYISKVKTATEKTKKAKSLSDEMKFKDYAFKHQVPFKPIRLSEAINTRYSEYSPSLALDGSGMIFTRNTGQEDFFISMRDTINTFGASLPLFELNTPQNEGAHAISADGKMIVYTACDRRDTYGSCDLYYAYRTDNKWSKPVNMGKTINSAAWDSQPTLSPDGRMMIFSSKRLGSIGGSDLWITRRDESNAWTVPINLGNKINTAGNDETPFLHADGQTLYFRSDGRPGMGGFDVFFTKKDSLNYEWQIPENLGYPINSEGQEGGMVVSLDGKNAYFASDVDFKTGKNMGNLDIFTFELYTGARPTPSTFVKGIVRDAVTGKATESQVTIKDVNTGLTVFSLRTDKDGAFLSGITAGKNYACIVEKDGYRYYAHNFDLSRHLTIHKPYYLDIKLIPLDKVSPSTPPVVLQNIFFHTGSAELLPQSQTEIDLLYQLLTKKPDLGIKIIGHTDNVGQDSDNLSLSLARAASVVKALVEKGIEKTRLKAEGKGETMPIAPNDTEEGRQKNRRTEFEVYNMKN